MIKNVFSLLFACELYKTVNSLIMLVVAVPLILLLVKCVNIYYNKKNKKRNKNK